MNQAFEGWINGIPPLAWERALAMDIGGASPNAMEWFARDPVSKSIVAYDEVVKITTDMREMVRLALPKMRHPDGQEYNYLFKIGDYENRVALDDMGRNGIPFTNAIKQNKLVSVHRLAGYLHPNPKRPFPTWHPRAGELGAPLLFITQACKTLISEIPQQKWKNERGGDSMKDELDRAVRHDAVDCALYVTRVLPAPAEIPVPKILFDDVRSLQSKLYWEDVKRFREKGNQMAPRKAYNPSHGGGRHWQSLLLSV
jgi:hypothetical protein